MEEALKVPRHLPLPSDMAQVAADTYTAKPRWAFRDVHVTLTQVGSYSVVGFRGTTKDKRDILRDIRLAVWWHHRVGFCHAGFLKGVLGVIDEIVLDLATPLREGKVIIVGHSLGGAMAWIASAYLVSLGVPPAALYLFEAARAGLWRCKRLVKRVAFVFSSWDGDDLVPLVPWPYLLCNVRKHFTRIGKARIDWWDDHRIAAVRADLRSVGL